MKLKQPIITGFGKHESIAAAWIHAKMQCTHEPSPKRQRCEKPGDL